MAIDSGQVRSGSEAALRQLGVGVPSGLPLLDEIETLRSESAALDRLASLFVAVAVRSGLRSDLGAAWILDKGHAEGLTAGESAYVLLGAESDPQAVIAFPADIEALWCLAWATGLVEHLSWTKTCDDDFVRRFPRVKMGSEAGALPPDLALRSVEEIAEALDLAYLLHASHVRARLAGGTLGTVIGEYAITGRRRALEWLVSDEEWSEISLDT